MAIAKNDIEILTTQILNDKCDILSCLKLEHIQIDSSLLPDQFFQKFGQDLLRITELCPIYTDDERNITSLDDIEDVAQSFDILDKSLQEPKTSATNNAGMIGNRKDITVSKRFGSMTDINKTLLRSLSSQNLNSTKLFMEPQSAAPRLGVNCNTTFFQRNMNNEKLHTFPKLNFKQLSDHNTLKKDIEMRLNSIDPNLDKVYSRLLWDISGKYKIAFDRLNEFFIEIQQIQSKSLKSENDILRNLDQSLLNVMLGLSESLNQVRFIAGNNNLYNPDGINEIDSFLSDDLTDILDHFYRTYKYDI